MAKPRGPGATRLPEVIKEFYLPGEFARRVGRSPDTVRQWVREGRLAAYAK